MNGVVGDGGDIETEKRGREWGKLVGGWPDVEASLLLVEMMLLC